MWLTGQGVAQQLVEIDAQGVNLASAWAACA
jgi:hypothetical protein